MQQIAFEALGTKWQILLDSQNVSSSLKSAITSLVSDFESRYSRFRSDSEISKINHSTKQTFKISKDLFSMLTFAQKLTDSSQGYFTPTLTPLLESFGYDSSLSFKKSASKNFSHSYELKNHSLIKSSKTQLDLGGLGKGFLIDKIASLLKENSQKYFLISGGGDIFATTHADGSAWHAAIVHPLDSSLSIAQVDLINQSLATSSPSFRHYKDFHHLLNPKTKVPSNNLLSVSILASSALVSDACATAVFVGPPSLSNHLAKKFDFDYLILDKNNKLTSSSKRFVVDSTHEE